jgi:hypothetical protein
MLTWSRRSRRTYHFKWQGIEVHGSDVVAHATAWLD